MAGSIIVKPPLGGVVRNTGFQDRPPFTAYDLLNLWPVEPFSGREILSSRPPRHTFESPSGTVTLLQNVSGLASGRPALSFIATFNGSVYWWNGGGFTLATGSFSFPTDQAIYAGTVFNKVYIPKSGSKPIVFDYGTGALSTLTETAGTAPTNSLFIESWQGAIWTVSSDEPFLLAGSRAGEPRDWDFAAPVNDEFGAVKTSVNDPGAIGAMVNAFVPLTNDVALVSTLAGLFALRGHPRQGGRFNSVSPNYILGQGAWCKGPDDTVYYLSPNGLMAMPPSPNAVPTPVSREKIPEELIGLQYDYTNPVVSLAYCSRWNGIIITVRGAQEQAWWYDTKYGGFFRMSFNNYPYVLKEHAPLITDQSSGVLWGGINLSRFDRFGSETFETVALIGPIRLAETPLQKSKIIRLKTVFGSDTPTGSGTFAVTVGTDGQDAVNRALSGTPHFRTSLSALSANDGVCFPHVSGHAAVLEFSQDSGRLAIEEQELVLTEAGVNRLPRSEQAVPQGEPVSFATFSSEFDAGVWTGYTQATPVAPTCASLPDFSHWIDLSRLPTTWWGNVNVDGSDIRATDSSNNELPTDLVSFDKTNKTGFLVVKMSQSNPPQSIRVWCGNPTAGKYSKTHPRGQYNAYDSHWRAFWPEGGIEQVDRTQYANDLTLTGVDSAGLTTVSGGLLGLRASNYRFYDNTNNFGRATNSVPTTYPATLVVVTRNASVDHSIECHGIRQTSGSQSIDMAARRTAGGNHQTSVSSSGGGVANSGTLPAADVWRHNAGWVAAANSRAAYLDGGNKVTNGTSVSVSGLDEIIVGKGSRSPISSSSQPGLMALVQVHTIDRSDCWIDYQFKMLDQASFWGSWGDFVQVNDPPSPPDPNPNPPGTDVCPTGIITPTESGSWSGYATATPISPDATLMFWGHWVNLALMPAAWWSAVKADGGDIRVTDRFNKFIPFDLILFDKVAQTGFLVAMQTQRKDDPSPLRIWVGNSTATAVSPCAYYGRYRVYDKDCVGFWPLGGGEDRTQYRNDLTAVGGVSVGSITGPIGMKATNFNGSQWCTCLLTNKTLPLFSNNVTAAAVVRVSGFTQTGAVVSACRHPEFLAHCSLMHVPGTNPTRFRLRTKGETYDAVSGVTESLSTWTHKCGVVKDNVRRTVSVSGSTEYEAPKKHRPTRELKRVTIGARITGAGEVYWPFTGDICLVSLYRVRKSLTNEWAKYQNSMLNQSAFYGTWTWVAETNSLPQ